MAALAPIADAGCGCSGGCAVGNWDPSAFLNSDVPAAPYDNSSGSNSSASVSSSSVQGEPKPEPRSDTFPNEKILKSLETVSSSNVVLDVSNGNGYSRSHIKGALLVPSKNFLNSDGTLKSAQELADVLGNAGVSNSDPVVVYSDNPSDATFAFWVLGYLGHNDVKVLDGSTKDWSASDLPVDSAQSTRKAVTYTLNLKPDLLANYDYVKRSGAQIVDVRPFLDFGKGRVPSAIYLDPAGVLKNGKINDKSKLDAVFSNLIKDKPIVVYSDDYSEASVVWYALDLMGYNAKLYTWSDWIAHQPASESGKGNDPYKKLG